MKQLHALWLLVTTGVSSLLEVGNMIIDGTKVKFRSAPGPAGVRTVLDDSDIVSTLGGNQTDKVPSAAAVAAAVAGSTLTVNPNSTSFVSINAGQLEVKPLLITRPVIDAVSVSLTAALAARTPVYNLANVTNNTADLQAGDSLILPLHTGGLRVFMHNGGLLGTIADFTLVEEPALSTSTIRALLTAVNGLTYDNVSGQFKLGGTISEDTSLTLDAVASRRYRIFNSDGTSQFYIANSGFGNEVAMYHQRGLFQINTTGLTLGVNTTGSQARFNDSRPALEQFGLEYNSIPLALRSSSLIHKGYVDTQISNNTIGKANVTVNTTAGVWTTVVHNFALTAGNFDNLLVTMFDSAGVGVNAPFRVKNANEIEVLTAEAVTGLKVRMLKTL